MSLQALAQRLNELPRLKARANRGGLSIAVAGAKAKLRSDQIGEFSAAERKGRLEAGESFIDTKSGTVYVEAPGIYVFTRLENSGQARLTAYQCALLAAVLDQSVPQEAMVCEAPDSWFEAGLNGPQIDLIRRLDLELGVRISPMGMSRFLDALGRREVVTGDSTEERVFSRESALDTVRDDFEIKSVGGANLYAGRAEEVVPVLEERLGDRIVRGVSEVLLRETGVLISPIDLIVERGGLDEVVRTLGKPVARGYEGPTLLIRTAQRVPLSLLTLGRGVIQPMLAAATAMHSDSPIGRTAGLALWKAWR